MHCLAVKPHHIRADFQIPMPGMIQHQGIHLGPYVSLAQQDHDWLAYARLVAEVSADPRWDPIAAGCFDPTAALFLVELAALYPGASKDRLARGFVY